MGVAAARDPNDPSQTIVLASDGGSRRGARLRSRCRRHARRPQTSIALRPARRHALPAQIAVSHRWSHAHTSPIMSATRSIEIDLATRAVVRADSGRRFSALRRGRTRRCAFQRRWALSVSSAAHAAAANRSLRAPAFDPAKSSSLSVLALGGQRRSPIRQRVPMDPAPDGTQIVGGAAPGAIALSKDGRLAYVALANVDRVAVVSLDGVAARRARTRSAPLSRRAVRRAAQRRSAQSATASGSTSRWPDSTPSRCSMRDERRVTASA